jgi:NAD(P)H-quinone oxidoreductase subunit 6
MKLPESFCETISISLELSLVLASLGVVLLIDIVHSAFLLGFVFACTALLYLFLDSDFLAAAQILIYVGAVNVLIVFAVMLMNKERTEKFLSPWILGDGIALIICIGTFSLLDGAISNTPWSQINLVAQSTETTDKIPMDSIRRIGSELLTEFLIPFELMSLILLVALIGAITLARVGKTTKEERGILRGEETTEL